MLDRLFSWFLSPRHGDGDWFHDTQSVTGVQLELFDFIYGFDRCDNGSDYCDRSCSDGAGYDY